MTIDNIVTYINNNSKNWNIEQHNDIIKLSKNNVLLTITTDTIKWKTSSHENRYDIDTDEENLKILLSRDWIEQTYFRRFGYIAKTNNPNEDIWPEDFVEYIHEQDDPFSFVQHIKWRANNYGESRGGGTISMETVCSLDKYTLNAMNGEIEAQVSDGVGESCELVSLVSDGYFYKDK